MLISCLDERSCKDDNIKGFQVGDYLHYPLLVGTLALQEVDSVPHLVNDPEQLRSGVTLEALVHRPTDIVDVAEESRQDSGRVRGAAP